MPATRKTPRYYPAFVDIEGRRCVVIGGGKVAERKVRDLLRAGASVYVISPELSAGLKKIAGQGRIKHIQRGFRATDLKDAFLAIAATDDEKTNSKVAAHGARMLVNVVDKPDLCSFIVPSALKRGPLTIAVSTSGASPAMARSIRQELEGMFGKEVGQYLEKLCRIRERATREISDPVEREKKLKALGSPEALAGLLSKRPGGNKRSGK
jgi:precorrin-2 dehydrogenase/sirohydrochlorin ferrochelatase